MKFKSFNIAEMFSDSCGKTSISLVCGFLMILTGCLMGLKSAWIINGEIALQGLGFSTAGAGLLGIRRFTKDKDLSQDAK